MPWTIFDIETGPLDDDTLQILCPPFDEGKYTAPFDERQVKTGNLKDPKKIADKIESAREEHRKAAERIESDRASHFQKFKESAALSPASGRVLVIAMCDVDDGSVDFLDNGHEPTMLRTWWGIVRDLKKAQQYRLAGVNIFNFDLPFLVRRSWILGVPVPSFIIDMTSKWMNWDPIFFDLRLAWQCGNRQEESSFDHIGKALGTGGKTVGDIGKDFAEVYRTDRARALQYAANDVRQPAAWLYRMGLISGPVPDHFNPPIDAEFTIEEEGKQHASEPAFDNI